MGFGERRPFLAAGLGFTIAIALLPTTPAADVSAPALGGVVHDTFGQVLSGVEVLILPERSSDKLASSVTGEDGRFRVPTLPSGLYRIAALKPGYLASVTRANTFLRSTVDVVLHPVPRPGEPGAESVTSSPSWVLRVPPRSILRETDLGDIARTPVTSEAAARSSEPSLTSHAPSLDLIDGQLRHLVALGGNAPDNAARSGPIVGGETNVQLSGSLGQRGVVRMAGRRERLATSRADTEGTPAGSRSAESLAFDISYDTSGESSVDVSAYFAQGDVRVGPVVAKDAEANREARRAWGYDATWTRQLDPVSRVAVRLGYRDASLEVPDSYLSGLGESVVADARNLSNRSLGAAGTYEVLAGDNHSLRVGARAQAIDLALPLVRDGGESMFVDVPGGAGWSFRIDAEDAWSISAPWTVVYGLGIQQVLQGSDTTLFVPRAGAAWSPGAVDLRLMLSYFAVAEWGSPTPAQSELAFGSSLSPAAPLGWEGEIALPLSKGMSLRATQSYEPLRDISRAIGEPGPALAASPLIVGTQASDRRNSVAVTRASARASSSFAVNWGRAEGMIGQAARFELPVQILSERAVEYRSGRFDVTAPAWGTALSLEFGEVEETLPGGSEAAIVNRYFELALGQQIAQLSRLGATCRLLLAARVVPLDESDDDGSAQFERSRAIAALNQQFSAGLLVNF